MKRVLLVFLFSVGILSFVSLVEKAVGEPLVIPEKMYNWIQNSRPRYDYDSLVHNLGTPEYTSYDMGFDGGMGRADWNKECITSESVGVTTYKVTIYFGVNGYIWKIFINGNFIKGFNPYYNGK